MLQQTILFPLLIAIVSSHEEQIFATKARLDVSWIAAEDQPSPLSFQELHSLTNLVAPYLQELLSQEDDGTMDERVTFDVTMEVADHVVSDDQLMVKSIVTMWYMGHESVDNLAYVLDQALIEQNGLPAILKDVEFIQPGASGFLVTVSTVQQDTEVLHSFDTGGEVSSTSSTGGLVAVIIFLLLALIFVSCVLFWYAGGFPVFKEKVQRSWYNFSNWICRRSCEDKDDAATSASGILGANPSSQMEDENRENSLPAGFTPNRGVFREQDCDDSQILSPVSTNTDYSTTSRVVPLGIQPPSLHFRSTPHKSEGNATNPYKRDISYS